MLKCLPINAGLSIHSDLVNCGILYLATFDIDFTK